MSPEPERRSGVLVLVVGPSGAGKDAIIRQARERLGPGGFVVFARRVVTRPADEDENNEPATPDMFEAARQRGDFALDWTAHGLRYGVPWRVLAALEQGGIVVANGSRSIAAQARARVNEVRIVLVTAPPEILRARILGRGRESDPAARLAREGGTLDELKPDLVIDNAGSLDRAVGLFIDFLFDLHRR